MTHPLSTVANQPTALSATVVDPDGQPVNVSWSSDCLDGQFTDPESATTEWTKSTQGTCTISMTASDGELTTVDSFKVVVFGEGANTGAVDVNGVFVAAPNIYLNLGAPNAFCDVFTGAVDGTCSGEIASPEVASLNAFVEWGFSEPGTVEVSDNCGGSLQLFGQDPFFLGGEWRPPTGQTVCLISVRASTPEGVSSEVSAAILVRDGQPPPPPAGAQIEANFFHGGGSCFLPLGETLVDCPQMQVDDIGFLDATVDWGGQPPGFVEVFDSCGGEFLILDNQDPFFVHAEWLTSQPGDCELRLRAVQIDGVVAAEAALRFPVDGGAPPPPPPAGVQISATFSHPLDFCELFFGQLSVDCQTMPLGEIGILDANIDWAGQQPGSVQVFDTCGGDFLILDNQDPFFVHAEWAANQPGSCELHIRADSIDGTSTEAILSFPVM